MKLEKIVNFILDKRVGLTLTIGCFCCSGIYIYRTIEAASQGDYLKASLYGGTSMCLSFIAGRSFRT